MKGLGTKKRELLRGKESKKGVWERIGMNLSLF